MHIACEVSRGMPMGADVDGALEKLREHFRVETDAELARRLKIGQSTISTWKSRGRVPDRVMRMLDGETNLALGLGPVYWGPYENTAFGLALIRFARMYGSAEAGEDFRAEYRAATRPGDFWSLFLQAQEDLRIEMEKSEGGLPQEALALILHDDRDDPECAKTRMSDTIERGRPSVEWDDGSVTKF